MPEEYQLVDTSSVTAAVFRLLGLRRKRLCCMSAICACFLQWTLYYCTLALATSKPCSFNAALKS